MTQPKILLLCLVALSLPIAISPQTNPTNILGALLQASKQQLNAAASQGATLRNFQTLTNIMNSVFKAMQTLTLPYYSSQISLLINQQLALQNRLTLLRANAMTNSSALQAGLESVSKSLFSQVSGLGNMVFQFQNLMNFRLSGLNNQIGSLGAASQSLGSKFAALVSTQANGAPAIDNFSKAITDQVSKLAEKIIPASKIVFKNYVVTGSEPVHPTNPACIVVSFPLGFFLDYTNLPDVFVNPVGTSAVAGVSQLDITINSLTPSELKINVCQRNAGQGQGTLVQFAPTTLYLVIFSND